MISANSSTVEDRNGDRGTLFYSVTAILPEIIRTGRDTPYAYNRNWTRSRDAGWRHGDRYRPNAHHNNHFAEFNDDEHQRREVLGCGNQAGAHRNAGHEQRQQHNERE